MNNNDVDQFDWTLLQDDALCGDERWIGIRLDNVIIVGVTSYSIHTPNVCFLEDSTYLYVNDYSWWLFELQLHMCVMIAAYIDY